MRWFAQLRALPQIRLTMPIWSINRFYAVAIILPPPPPPQCLWKLTFVVHYFEFEQYPAICWQFFKSIVKTKSVAFLLWFRLKPCFLGFFAWEWRIKCRFYFLISHWQHYKKESLELSFKHNIFIFTVSLFLRLSNTFHFIEMQKQFFVKGKFGDKERLVLASRE